MIGGVGLGHVVVDFRAELIEVDTEIGDEGSICLGGIDITGDDDVVATVEEFEDLVVLEVSGFGFRGGEDNQMIIKIFSEFLELEGFMADHFEIELETSGLEISEEG